MAWSDTMMLSDLFPWVDYGEDDSLEEALSDLNDLDGKSVSGIDPSLRRKAVEEIYQKLAHSI
ncbi:MAG: hypothetical protein LKF58_02315 [Bacilli bacterium]|nr:hypothetical protein [Bacilli bacterium]MCH4277869.1 hypothetical protein [Bacilli bacterium]